MEYANVMLQLQEANRHNCLVQWSVSSYVPLLQEQGRKEERQRPHQCSERSKGGPGRMPYLFHILSHLFKFRLIERVGLEEYLSTLFVEAQNIGEKIDFAVWVNVLPNNER